MWPYHPDLLAQPVPRYTSYPTAAEFHEGLGSAHMGEALAGIAPDAPVSLYLHIPFCERICWYCGCNTGRTNRPERIEAYLDSLRAEIALVGAALGGRGRISRIAFGGGSPNAIAPAIFLDLIERIDRAFTLDAPTLSVEIDPRSFTDDWARALRTGGVTRASLGVQTLDAAIQQCIGRVQPLDMIRAVSGALRDAGVSSINFDLMYGLPGQGMGELEATLARACEMAPERIALFGYAHVPHMVPRQRQIDADALPDAGARFAQAARGHELLTDAGYQPIGFDHFALPGDAIAIAARDGQLRRNFQGFTEDKADVLIGLGASSISMFPDRLIQTEKTEGRYRMKVLAGQFPVERGILRDAAEQSRARLIEQLLCAGEVDVSGLAERDALVARFAVFAAHGLVDLAGYRLTLRPGALPYARTIAACLDPWRQATRRQFSSAI